MTQQSPKYINLLTHMNSSWEALTFGQNSESIFKTGDGIFSWGVLSLNWFMTLNKN